MVSVVRSCPFALAPKHEIRVGFVLTNVVKNLLSLFSLRATHGNAKGLSNTFSVYIYFSYGSSNIWLKLINPISEKFGSYYWRYKKK